MFSGRLTNSIEMEVINSLGKIKGGILREVISETVLEEHIGVTGQIRGLRQLSGQIKQQHYRGPKQLTCLYIYKLLLQLEYKL